MVSRPAILNAALVVAMSISSAAAEEEKASKTDIGIAATVLGMVSFVMVLYYFLNWPDADVRQYAYEAVSSTISIFCAVLSFQAFDNFLEVYILDFLPLPMKVAFDMTHMLFWFVVLQATLAWVTGAVGETFAVEKPKEEASLEAKFEHDKMEMFQERNIKCFGILLAHISGFAAINAFGSMQQLHFFKSNAFLSFLAVPIAVGVLWAIFHLMNTLRTKVSHGDDGSIDEAEEKWDEETEEAEDDVFGLAVSFLLVQSLRFLLCGSLANEEGEEEEEVLLSHTKAQVILLFACAGLFAAAIFGFIFYMEEEEEEGEGEGEEKKEEGEEKKEGEEGGGSEAAERSFEEAVLVSATMGFAWSVFYSCRWMLSRTSIGDDEMGLAFLVAMSASLLAMFLIIPLDKLADMDATGPRTDKAIIQIIRGLGILIGFAWEQCFDQAVASLASGFGHAAGAVKLAMACFVVAIIVPAWHMYILPYFIEQGWKTGFVVEDAVKNLNNPDSSMSKEEKVKDIKKTKKLLKACQDRLQVHGDYEALASGPNPSEVEAGLKKEVETLKQKFSEHVEGSLKHSQAMMDRLAKIQAKLPNN
mmetsp:Transcript_7849/g.17235  ORF Transcript_7849/g.17235 Transcript_7849/m.17235 type:complete len:587 (-) Transcript_7849:256-2016(-)|eukprot:CAMPEP_0178416772 /NCGR_PEP_ID=MMETSP0689_2-20121128/24235_1 /TAXON_ID=160604 /ORGANISM="Amphidinium massartii, Strain CS-259" /LENGTH=586 /DNA_ID=CAMNT_0020038125 /DNA_START=78 /DNA_END=1838 /DNA_ORIENTATION=+